MSGLAAADLALVPLDLVVQRLERALLGAFIGGLVVLLDAVFNADVHQGLRVGVEVLRVLFGLLEVDVEVFEDLVVLFGHRLFGGHDDGGHRLAGRLAGGDAGPAFLLRVKALRVPQADDVRLGPP